MQQPSAACTRAQPHVALVLPAFGCCILLLLLLSLSTQDGLDPLQLAMVVVYIFICHQLTQILHLHALMVAIMQNVLVALFSMYECAQQAEVVLAHVVFVL